MGYRAERNGRKKEPKNRFLLVPTVTSLKSHFLLNLVPRLYQN